MGNNFNIVKWKNKYIIWFLVFFKRGSKYEECRNLVRLWKIEIIGIVIIIFNLKFVFI